MTNLPKRKSQIDVEHPDENEDGVLHLKTMSDPQAMASLKMIESLDGGNGNRLHVQPKDGGWYEIRRNGELLEKVQGKQKARERKRELEGVEKTKVDTANPHDVEMLEPLFGLVDQNIRGATNLTIGEDPFDPEDESHINSIPMVWKAVGVGALIEEAVMPAEVGKG